MEEKPEVFIRMFNTFGLEGWLRDAEASGRGGRAEASDGFGRGLAAPLESALQELKLVLHAAPFVRVVGRGLAAGDRGPFTGEFGVERDELLLVGRDVLLSLTASGTN